VKFIRGGKDKLLNLKVYLSQISNIFFINLFKYKTKLICLIIYFQSVFKNKNIFIVSAFKIGFFNKNSMDIKKNP